MQAREIKITIDGDKLNIAFCANKAIDEAIAITAKAKQAVVGAREITTNAANENTYYYPAETAENTALRALDKARGNEAEVREAEKTLVNLLLLSALSTRLGSNIRKTTGLLVREKTLELFSGLYVNAHLARPSFNEEGRFDGFTIDKKIKLLTDVALEEEEDAVASVQGYTGEGNDASLLEGHINTRLRAYQNTSGVKGLLQTNNNGSNGHLNIPSPFAVALLANKDIKIDEATMTTFTQTTRENNILANAKKTLDTQNSSETLAEIINSHITRLKPTSELKTIIKSPKNNFAIWACLKCSWLMTNGNRQLRKLKILEAARDYLAINPNHTFEAALNNTKPTDTSIAKVKSTLFAGQYSQIARDLAKQPTSTLKSLLQQHK